MKGDFAITKKETIFITGNDYFANMINDINSAEHSIDLETYIFRSDFLGKQIGDALLAARHRGIKIRVMVDGAGSPSFGGGFVRKLEKSGIETKVFHPFPWRFWQWNRTIVRFPLVTKLIYLFLKANSRDHRKTCIIDNKIVYVGSMNITKSHLPLSMKGDNWYDIGVRLIDSDIKPLKQAFELSWDHKDIQERLRDAFKHVNKNPVFRLNNSRHRRRILYKNLLKRISRCRQRIWITNSYFVPDNILLKKLSDAAETGVDVRILLPRKSDIFIMPWASTTFYRDLLKAGVRIYEYLPSILHAKALILDDWYVVGSSNLNHRSLLHDLEVDVNLREEESKRFLERNFLQNLENSSEINLDNWTTRPRYQRFFGRLFLYAKYWI